MAFHDSFDSRQPKIRALKFGRGVKAGKRLKKARRICPVEAGAIVAENKLSWTLPSDQFDLRLRTHQITRTGNTAQSRSGTGPALFLRHGSRPIGNTRREAELFDQRSVQAAGGPER
jgi:hypothetical protein